MVVQLILIPMVLPFTQWSSYLYINLYICLAQPVIREPKMLLRILLNHVNNCDKNEKGGWCFDQKVYTALDQ